MNECEHVIVLDVCCTIKRPTTMCLAKNNNNKTNKQKTKNKMGGQYDINRQESPTTHVLPSPTEEVWSQQEDPHTVLSGSY